MTDNEILREQLKRGIVMDLADQIMTGTITTPDPVASVLSEQLSRADTMDPDTLLHIRRIVSLRLVSHAVSNDPLDTQLFYRVMPEVMELRSSMGNCEGMPRSWGAAGHDLLILVGATKLVT